MNIRRVVRIICGTALLVGLTYSVLALTLTPKTAYASVCDCDEALVDAQEYCVSIGFSGYVGAFSCPQGPGPYYALFKCEEDTIHWHAAVCD